MTDFDPSVALAAARDGDEAAWKSIVAAYSGLLWSVARGFRLSNADAGDVVQVTWLRLVENLGTLREARALPTWLATTTRREAINVLRQSGRNVPVDDVEVLGSRAPGDVDERLLRDESQRALAQAVSKLPEACQRLLRVLFTDPPPSYETASAVLDMPIGSIGPSRARCLRGLRSLLAE